MDMIFSIFFLLFGTFTCLWLFSERLDNAEYIWRTLGDINWAKKQGTWHSTLFNNFVAIRYSVRTKEKKYLETGSSPYDSFTLCHMFLCLNHATLLEKQWCNGLFLGFWINWIYSHIQCHAKTWIYFTPYVCSERIFDSRPFMLNKIFWKKI